MKRIGHCAERELTCYRDGDNIVWMKKVGEDLYQVVCYKGDIIINMKTFLECRLEAINRLSYTVKFNVYDYSISELAYIYELAAKIYAESALDTAAEVAETDQDGDIYGGSVWVDKQTILSLKDQLK